MDRDATNDGSQKQDIGSKKLHKKIPSEIFPR